MADDTLSKLQQMNKESHVVVVQFKEEANPAWFAAITEISKIENSDSHTWKLETGNPDLVRKQLFELALQHNLNIVSLQSEQHSLEDVFRNLTGKA